MQARFVRSPRPCSWTRASARRAVARATGTGSPAATPPSARCPPSNAPLTRAAQRPMRAARSCDALSGSLPSGQRVGGGLEVGRAGADAGEPAGQVVVLVGKGIDLPCEVNVQGGHGASAVVAHFAHGGAGAMPPGGTSMGSWALSAVGVHLRKRSAARAGPAGDLRGSATLRGTGAVFGAARTSPPGSGLR